MTFQPQFHEVEQAAVMASRCWKGIQEYVYIPQANKIHTFHSNKVGSVLSQSTELILHPSSSVAEPRLHPEEITMFG